MYKVYLSQIDWIKIKFNVIYYYVYEYKPKHLQIEQEISVWGVFSSICNKCFEARQERNAD